MSEEGKQPASDYTHPNGGEREFEIGKDEAWYANVKRTYDHYQHLDMGNTSAWDANTKRTYDAYQDIDLIAGRRSQDHYDALMADSRRYTNDAHALSLGMMQHAFERMSFAMSMTTERVGSHRDIFTDRVWNLDEVARIAAGVDPGNTALIMEMVKETSKNGPITTAMLVDAIKAVADAAKR